MFKRNFSGSASIGRRTIVFSCSCESSQETFHVIHVVGSLSLYVPMMMHFGFILIRVVVSGSLMLRRGGVKADGISDG